MELCDAVAAELERRNKYKEAISIYTIILDVNQQAKYYNKRAECYKNEKLFVEAAKDLAYASHLAPNLNASISNREYYY